MIGLSTCFYANKNYSGREIVLKARQIGAGYLELEYRLSEDDFYDVLKASDDENLPVVSLHNYCYRPEIIPANGVDADFFRLSSIDEDERKQAVHYTIKTIEHAEEAEAKFVILHCGNTGQARERESFNRLSSEDAPLSSRARKFLDDFLKERHRHAQKCMEQVKRSLERIIPAAEEKGIQIGIENRYHLHQIPSFKELGTLLDDYRDAPVGMWLDVGHAFVQEKWGLHGIYDYLEAYASRLLGIHIHDAGGGFDHRPPGFGGIDFSILGKYVNSTIPQIVEVNAHFTENELASGIALYRDSL